MKGMFNKKGSAEKVRATVKRFCVLAFAVALTLGWVAMAQAVTIDDPANGEMNLYLIFQDPSFAGGSYASSQDIATLVPISETLPAGTYTVTAYAKYAGFTQDPGIYYPVGSASATKEHFFPSPLTGEGIYTGLNTSITTATPIGFFDDTNGGGTEYTELSLNDAGALGQSNGLIFEISPPTTLWPSKMVEDLMPWAIGTITIWFST